MKIISVVVIPLCFSIFFFALAISIEKKKRLCTDKIDGCVVSIQEYPVDNPRYCCPNYQYIVSGETYKAKGHVGSFPIPMSEGNSVTLMYDPKNPKRSYILGYDNKLFIIKEIIFSILGIMGLFSIVSSVLRVFF